MQQLEEPVATRTQSSRPPAPLPVSAIRVLVVHRDASYRRTLAAYLEGQGYEVVAASGGREALRDACEQRPNAVLMDLEGDEFDEFELLACLARLPRRVPAIVCTAYGNSSGPELTVLHELGVQHILPRPCRFELIVRALHELGTTSVAANTNASAGASQPEATP
jgi:CheY-like chemotaxis protein